MWFFADFSCQSCEREFIVTSGIRRPTSETFNKYLPFFLQDIPESNCAKAGKAAYSDVNSIHILQLDVMNSTFGFLAFRLFKFYPIKSIRCLWAITPEWLLRMTFTRLWQKREKLQTKFRMLCDREINRPNFSHTGENVVKFKKKHFELMTHEKQNPTIC